MGHLFRYSGIRESGKKVSSCITAAKKWYLTKETHEEMLMLFSGQLDGVEDLNDK